MESPPRAGWTGKQAVEVYVRTYTTMLQSSGDIKIDSLVHAHLAMGSVLHPLAGARAAVGASEEDWLRLRQAWGDDFDATLATIRREECRIVLRLIGGSHLGYARNASRWWQPIAAAMEEMGMREAPIYFVSSNTHSLVNVFTGVARRFEKDILEFVRTHDPELDDELRKLEAGHSRASRYN